MSRLRENRPHLLPVADAIKGVQLKIDKSDISALQRTWHHRHQDQSQKLALLRVLPVSGRRIFQPRCNVRRFCCPEQTPAIKNKKAHKLVGWLHFVRPFFSQYDTLSYVMTSIGRRCSSVHHKVSSHISQERFDIESPNFTRISTLMKSTITPDMTSPATCSRQLSWYLMAGLEIWRIG